MAILITGGTGFIGSHTAISLIEAGKEVILVDDLSNSTSDIVNRIETITSVRPLFYDLSVLDKAGLREIFEENKIDSVIHFAAFKAVGESVYKPLEYYSNNLTGLLTVLEVMKEFDVKTIVFSSSATVYGLDNVSPLTEELPTSATNPYGYTKVMNEQILRDLAHSDPSWNIGILRYFNPIGAHKSGLIGENPRGIPNNLMPYITQVAIGKLEKVSVFGNDYPTHDGTGVRDYIHVVDLAEGHVSMLAYLESNSGCSIFNLGTGQGYSVLDLITTFSEVNNLNIPYVITERRPGDIAECYANPLKAETLLGWKAKKDLTEMCRDSWHWEKMSSKQ